MKTIIVPTDFSDTAYNAARYALGLAAQMGTARIILYHAYELIMPIPDIPATVPVLNVEELKEGSLEGLSRMKQELSAFQPADVVIEYRAENHLRAANIDEVCKEEQADLVVMGITGGSQLEEILVGSNTIDVIKNTTTPVIVVPGTVAFKPIHKIIFACDLKKIGDTTPIGPLTKILSTFNAELHVLYIDHDNKSFKPETPMEASALNKLLQGYEPKYHFIDHENIVQGITEFAEKENADLILTIPRKHGFFESIFKRSKTSQLAFHTHIPLLAIHE